MLQNDCTLETSIPGCPEDVRHVSISGTIEGSEASFFTVFAFEADSAVLDCGSWSLGPNGETCTRNTGQSELTNFTYQAFLTCIALDSISNETSYFINYSGKSAADLLVNTGPENFITLSCEN